LTDEILAQGKKAIPPSVMKKLEDINNKIMSHPKVGEWLRLCEKEKKGYWQDPETGIVMPFLADGFLNIKALEFVLI
jgi:hypothetical protein